MDQNYSPVWGEGNPTVRNTIANYVTSCLTQQSALAQSGLDFGQWSMSLHQGKTGQKTTMWSSTFLLWECHWSGPRHPGSSVSLVHPHWSGPGSAAGPALGCCTGLVEPPVTQNCWPGWRRTSRGNRQRLLAKPGSYCSPSQGLSKVHE